MKTKHGLFFSGAVLLLTAIFSFSLAGCDNGTTDPNRGSSQGTLSVHNNTTYAFDDIVLVELYKGTTVRGTPAVTYNAPITHGANHSWNLDPGAYIVRVIYAADTYENDPLTLIINIEKGQTTNVSYTGDTLK